MLIFGGSLEAPIKPIELGLGGAQSHETTYTATNGTLDNDASATRTSLGGYAEFDVGRLAFPRSLVLGFGLNRTEVVDKVDNFEQHYQGAAYVVFGGFALPASIGLDTLTGGTGFKLKGVAGTLSACALT